MTPAPSEDAVERTFREASGRLLGRLGDQDAARVEFERAAELTDNPAERSLLEKRRRHPST